MKKTLFLFMTALLLSTAANAQFKVNTQRFAPIGDQPEATVNPATFANSASDFLLNATVEDAPAMEIAEDVDAVTDGRRKAYVDPASGVFYQVPKGSLYVSAYNNYAYVALPAFLTHTFINKVSPASSATWLSGGSNAKITSVTTDNNLLRSYAKPASANSAWYAPKITNGTDTFRLGGLKAISDTKSYVVGTLQPRLMSTINIINSNSSGFANMTFFGTHTSTVSSTDPSVAYGQTLIQHMVQPVKPLYVDNIQYNFNCFGDSTDTGPFATDDTYVMFYIYKLKTENSLSGATVFYSTRVNKNNITDLNVTGTASTKGTMKVPVNKVIDFPYAIVISGFHKEGVNFGLYMSQVGAGADYYPRGGVYPTQMQRVKEDGTGTGYNYVQYNATSGNQYNAVIYIVGMYDVATIDSDSREIELDPKGGYDFLYAKTLKEWTDSVTNQPNYSVDGLDDWLTVPAVLDTYYKSLSYNLPVVQAGPNLTGAVRTDTVCIVSPLGAKSENVVVTQQPIPDLYILGQVDGKDWAPNDGVKIDFDVESGTYKKQIEVSDNLEGFGWFSFTTKLSDNADDWNAIKPYRIGAVSEGDFVVTDEQLDKELSLVYAEEPNAFKTPAGKYDIEVNLDSMKVILSKVPEPAPDVYILGEVNGKVWAANDGVKMTLGENGLYTATITTAGENEGFSYFSFTKQLADSAADWDAIAAARFGAVSEGDFVVTSELIGQKISLENGGDALKIPAGEFNLTLNLDSMFLIVEGEIVEPQPEPEDVYILGDVNGNAWGANIGEQMAYVDSTAVYVKDIEVANAYEGKGYFSFTTKLAEGNEGADWNAIAPFRFGAVSEGNFVFQNEQFGQEISLTYDNGQAIEIAAGRYSIVVDKANMKLIINKNVLLGDANGDGEVNSLDVTAIIGYILGNPIDNFVFVNANVNNDEDVNASDVTAVIGIILNSGN